MKTILIDPEVLFTKLKDACEHHETWDWKKDDFSTQLERAEHRGRDEENYRLMPVINDLMFLVKTVLEYADKADDKIDFKIMASYIKEKLMQIETGK